MLSAGQLLLLHLLNATGLLNTLSIALLCFKLRPGTARSRSLFAHYSFSQTGDQI